jgi:hypothetical protein
MPDMLFLIKREREDEKRGPIRGEHCSRANLQNVKNVENADRIIPRRSFNKRRFVSSLPLVSFLDSHLRSVLWSD